MRFLILPLTIFYALTCYSWGQKGHDTIAYIAEQHLSEKAKIAVDSILDGKSMVYWSNWLDNASHTLEYEYTKTWHYKNIDEGVCYATTPLNAEGDIVTALYQQIENLKSGDISKAESAISLKMIIHLMGDLHQPLHLGHKSDLGGNKWEVKYFNRKNNLHSIWDSSLVESAHKWSYTEWQQQIDRVSESQIASYTVGSIDNWGEETYLICCEVYNSTPIDSNISYDYIAKWTPVIETQFLKGGVRLASIINSIFQ